MKKIFGSIALVAVGVVLKTAADKYGLTEVVVKKASELKAKAVEYVQSLVNTQVEEQPAADE